MFPYINMFDHEASSIISTIRNLTVGVFEHIEITSIMDVDRSIKYTYSIMGVPALNIYQQFLAECKDSSMGLPGYQWCIRLEKVVSMEQFWTWAKVNNIDGSGYLSAYWNVAPTQFEK